MKHSLLLILFFVIIPFASTANEIKPERKKENTKVDNKANSEVPCCLVIALNSQNQLFSIYNAGHSSCLEYTDTIQMQQCFAFWNAFQSAGQTAIENELVACEAIYGPNGMNCGNF